MYVVCFGRSRLMSTMEDLLFYTITEGQEMIPFSQFISVSHQHIGTSCVVPKTVFVYMDVHTNTLSYSTIAFPKSTFDLSENINSNLRQESTASPPWCMV